MLFSIVVFVLPTEPLSKALDYYRSQRSHSPPLPVFGWEPTPNSERIQHLSHNALIFSASAPSETSEEKGYPMVEEILCLNRGIGEASELLHRHSGEKGRDALRELAVHAQDVYLSLHQAH